MGRRRCVAPARDPTFHLPPKSNPPLDPGLTSDELLDSLRDRAEQLARVSVRSTLKEYRERQQLGQLLHDSLQQDIAAAKFQLSALTDRLGTQRPKALASANLVIDRAIATARSLNADLSPAVLRHGCWADMLVWLADHFQSVHGLSVDLRIRSDSDSRDDRLRILVFDSLRELLLNVVQHAGVDHASLALEEGQGRLIFVLEDAGCGFDAASVFGTDNRLALGLIAIRERLRLLNGTLEIASEPGKTGTQVVLHLPLDQETQEGTAPVSAGSAPMRPLDGERSDDRRPAVRRVLLVDDHVMVRQALAHLIDQETDIQVIGEASDGLEAIEMIERLQPDVVLMDVSMPDLDGAATTRVILERWPQIRVLGLSMYECAACTADLLDAGAEAVLSKADVSETLLDGIRQLR